MTNQQFAERLKNLEAAVKELERKLAEQAADAEFDKHYVPSECYDLTTDLPPKASYTFRAKIRKVERPPAGLGLSKEEWARLPLEDGDE